MKLTKWLGLETPKAEPRPIRTYTPPEISYPEYDEMQRTLQHAKEWRMAGNPTQELRTLANLWRTCLDRQNVLRKDEPKTDQQ